MFYKKRYKEKTMTQDLKTKLIEEVLAKFSDKFLWDVAPIGVKKRP